MAFQMSIDNIKQRAQDVEGIVLINFWAGWSNASRQMFFNLREIDRCLDDHDAIVQVNWDQQEQLVEQLNVVGIPTLIIYQNGNEVARYLGVIEQDELLQKICQIKNRENVTFSKASCLNL